jgi:type II secretory pathway component GspD/PulD (secretin)
MPTNHEPHNAMKKTKLLIPLGILLLATPFMAQTSEPTDMDPAPLLVETTASEPDAGTTPSAPPAVPSAPKELPFPVSEPQTPSTETPAAVTPAASPMQASDEGYILKGAPLNDILQFLAKEAGRQYFHNAKLNGPEFLVTGHLNEGNALRQMEELSFMYGVTLHTKGDTIYALTASQLAQLPSAEFHYQLQYLRPTDIKQIQELIKPMLSPATGIINFEPKTNSIVIIDSAHRIEQAREFLRSIDRAKGQIVIETKILRINSTAAENMGVNWSSSLGAKGVPLSVTRDLASVFGLPSSPASSIIGGDGTNLVLSPVEVTGVLSALSEGGIASQISNPTLITEDNEQATISIIDRIPILTSTTTPGSGGTQPTVTEEVRYKIDQGDKSIDADPEKHREIGISLVVTPTLLPDGTVRMKMRPRSAQITGEVIGVGVDGREGNRYPRVSESMIETLARVPNGHSLVVGGFYGQTKDEDKTKVPLLGDIPIVNFFFRSKEAKKENTSLVFIVTPKSYDPKDRHSNDSASNFVRQSTALTADHDWVDDNNPGPAHEPNVARTIRGAVPSQAPYYPATNEAGTTSKSKAKRSAPFSYKR